MRRTVATLLISALLSSSGPLLMRDRGDRDRERGFNPTKIVKNIIRHLLPLDDSGIQPPKP